MLVLTRKLNEQVVIGKQGITIKIVDVRNGRVRLGVEAPESVRIERGPSHPLPAAAKTESEPVCS
jgi:carbon storage regulator